MQSIRQVQRLNELELEKCVPSNASWHTDYRDTAYIYIGGLPFELSEGDVLTLFSQYGNPVHVNLVRDKETGKSRGFAFLKYEDQRSCDLAVDNLSGATVLDRTLSVDHTRYKKKEGEVETVGDEEEEEEADETDRERDGRRKRRRTESGSERDEKRPMLKEEVELARMLKDYDDDDPMKAYMIKEKKAEVHAATVEEKLRRSKEAQRKFRRHHRRREREQREDGSDRDERRRDGRDRSREKGSHARDGDRDERDPSRERRRGGDGSDRDVRRDRAHHSHRSARSRTASVEDRDGRRRHPSRRDEPRDEDHEEQRKRHGGNREQPRRRSYDRSRSRDRR